MTSSKRHLKENQAFWDGAIKKYKSISNVFYEPDLFSIVVLALGRHEETKKSIESTLKCLEQYKGEIEWIFVENGNDQNNLNYFDSLDLERKVIIKQKNYGINHGLNQGWSISRGQYVMIHENDWIATNKIDFLSPSLSILKEDQEVGIIQLRDPFDPNENWGFRKPEYNPWSCTLKQLNHANLNIIKNKTTCQHTYYTCKFPNGFNNNPIILRKDVYLKCGPYPEPIVGSDPRHGETEYQNMVANTSYTVAFLESSPNYRHCGQIPTYKGV